MQNWINKSPYLESIGKEALNLVNAKNVMAGMQLQLTTIMMEAKCMGLVVQDWEEGLTETYEVLDVLSYYLDRTFDFFSRLAEQHSSFFTSIPLTFYNTPAGKHDALLQNTVNGKQPAVNHRASSPCHNNCIAPIPLGNRPPHRTAPIPPSQTPVQTHSTPSFPHPTRTHTPRTSRPRTPPFASTVPVR